MLETSIQVFSCEIFKISKNTFFYRTAPVAGSSEIQLVFSKESGTKTDVNVSNKYQIQLERSVYCCENLEAATVGVL